MGEGGGSNVVPMILVNSQVPCLTAAIPQEVSGAMKADVLAALALFFVVTYAGTCNDKRLDCANWAREGECFGENQVEKRLGLVRCAADQV